MIGVFVGCEIPERRKNQKTILLLSGKKANKICVFWPDLVESYYLCFRARTAGFFPELISGAGS
jgi:hypothetical protein